jgi:Cytochrome C biogenesis protein transmembrane region
MDSLHRPDPRRHLTLAASSATVVHGAFLLAAWSAGLGVPFLIAGLALGRVMAGMRRIQPVIPLIEVLAGSLVILVGVLNFLDHSRSSTSTSSAALRLSRMLRARSKASA